MAKKTVMAFGSFDILHPGHLHYLESAARLGDRLVVVVARDSSIRSIKGRDPAFTQSERARIVGAVKSVDLAVVGNRIRGPADFYKIIKRHRPDVIALGHDQRVDLGALKSWLAKNGLRTRVVRVAAFNSKRYKSSKIRKRIVSSS